MKQWYRTLPAKAFCFILCILALAVSAGCIFGAAMLVEFDFYSLPESYLLEDCTYDLVWGDAKRIAYSAMAERYADELEYFYSYDDHAFDPRATNLRYEIQDADGNPVGSNAADGETGKWTYFFRFSSGVENGELRLNMLFGTGEDADFTIRLYLKEGLPVQDEYALVSTLVHSAYALRYWIYPIGFLAILLFGVSLVTLLCASGRRPGSDGLYPGPFHRVPIDLLLAITITAFVFAILLATDIFYTGELLAAVLLIVIVVLAVIAAFGLSMSVAARVKQGTLLTNTIVWRVCKLLWRLAKGLWRGCIRAAKGLAALLVGIPLIWRTILVVVVSVVFDFIVTTMAAEDWDGAIFLWLLKNAVFAAALLYGAWFMRKLQKGGNALAAGELSYQVDTKGMVWDFKRHGENLNSIADGMSRAVEQRLQSERMKAELITNVSHDIKTPLTSIINYAGLIAEETCGSEKHEEYAEVLVRKSEHLKRLLDDLVEISKANTGNLDVALMPCDAGVLLTQTAGEFEQKCRGASLELITSQPDRRVEILADSRRIWRVFENLMNNACKYSLPGSRVYLTLTVSNGEALFVFRNTSRAALNVSPEELMERFLRGDASRSTEGNGLGLSIARSLTELQRGKMDIAIDGDLFKVTLRFPLL